MRALLLLLLLPLTVFADSDYYLAPTVGRFDDPYLVGYYGPLRKKLHESLPFRSQRPRFEVYVLPSFQEEWFMTFEENSSGDCTRGVVSWVEPSFWGAIHLKQKVETKSAVGCIPQPLFEEITCAAGSMLARTRYPSKPGGGLDGTSYSFRGWLAGYGVIEGSAWSPREGTPTHNLVRIAHGLSEMIKKPGELARHEAEVRGALTELTKQLAKMNADQPVHADAACDRAGNSRR